MDSESGTKPSCQATPPAQDARPVDDTAPINEPAKEPAQTVDIPENTKQLISLAFTILSVLLYGAILGGAIISSLLNSDAVFTPGALRATQILSGLVGTVVTAGFARPKSSNVSSYPRVKASGLLPSWFVQSKFLGLADTLGLNLRGIIVGREIEPLEELPVREVKINTATWVAILYFVIYFLVGAGSFAITVLRSEVPEIISSNAWVWLGTLITSSYTFFALGEDGSAA